MDVLCQILVLSDLSPHWKARRWCSTARRHTALRRKHFDKVIGELMVNELFRSATCHDGKLLQSDNFIAAVIREGLQSIQIVQDLVWTRILSRSRRNGWFRRAEILFGALITAVIGRTQFLQEAFDHIFRLLRFPVVFYSTAASRGQAQLARAQSLSIQPTAILLRIKRILLNLPMAILLRIEHAQHFQRTFFRNPILW